MPLTGKTKTAGRKATICPNSGCNSHEFEAIEMQTQPINGGMPWFIVQCKVCGYPIGVLNNTIPLSNAIRNIETKLTNSRSL
jgi:hypothetical protein